MISRLTGGLFIIALCIAAPAECMMRNVLRTAYQQVKTIYAYRSGQRLQTNLMARTNLRAFKNTAKKPFLATLAAGTGAALFKGKRIVADDGTTPANKIQIEAAQVAKLQELIAEAQKAEQKLTVRVVYAIKNPEGEIIGSMEVNVPVSFELLLAAAEGSEMMLATEKKITVKFACKGANGKAFHELLAQALQESKSLVVEGIGNLIMPIPTVVAAIVTTDATTPAATTSAALQKTPATQGSTTEGSTTQGSFLGGLFARLIKMVC